MTPSSIACRICIALGGLLLTAGIMCGVDSFYRPSIFLEQRILDFGERTVGDRSEVSVPIANHGRSPLRIEAIKVSCNCLHGTVDKRVLMPNEVANLTVVISETAPHERQSAGLVLATNDPVSPLTNVVVTSICHPASITFDCRVIDFGRVLRKDLPAKKQVSVLLPASCRRVTAVISGGEPGAAVTLAEGAIPGGQMAAVASVEIGRDAPSGKVTWEVAAGEEGGVSRDVAVVTATIIDEVYASPSLVTMKQRKSTSQLAEVRLVSRTDRSAVSIRSATPSRSIASWIKVERAEGCIRVVFIPVQDKMQSRTVTFGKRIFGSIKLDTSVLDHPVNVPVEIWP